MNDIEVISYKTVKIVYANLEGLSSSEAKKLVIKAKGIIQNYPPTPVYSLVNLTKMKFNTELKNEISEAGKVNAPYVRATALVGFNSITKLIGKTVIKLTGRKATLFDDVISAKEWLYLSSKG